MPRRRLLQALFVLLLLGAVKLPVERAVSTRLKQARLLDPIVDLGVWENLGQMSFAASLGGLRALIASVTYMRAYVAFEDVEWARVDSLFQLTSRLQPLDVAYWEEGSWHMAYNAASHYLHHSDVEPIMRGKLYHTHIARGIEILENGLRFNPGSVRLLARLGDIYARRQLDPEKAGLTYEQVALRNGPERYERLAAYEFLKTEKRELWQRAYTILKGSFDRHGAKFPAVVDGVKELERRLNIPPDQRIRASGSGSLVLPPQPADLPATR